MDDKTITFKGFYYFCIVNTSMIILKGGGHVRVQSGMTSLVTVDRQTPDRETTLLTEQHQQHLKTNKLSTE